MPQVGPNNEPLYERVIFGFDGANYQVIETDSDGKIVVAQAVSQDLQSNSYGYIGAGWKKNPLILGFSNALNAVYQDLSIPAGTSNHTIYTCLANKVANITAMTFRYIGTAPTYIRISIVSGSNNVYLEEELNVVSGVFFPLHLNWFLEEDDIIRLRIGGGTINNDIYTYVHGREIDLVT